MRTLAYSLTVDKIKTSQSHPIRVDYLGDDVAPFRGLIGMTFAPGKHQPHGATGSWARSLPADIERLTHHYFTNVLVSLIEDHELRELKIENLVEAFEGSKVRVARFPFPDQGVPSVELAKAAVIAVLEAAVNRRENVVIHCKGGLGRTGLIAACALVATGVDPAAAIRAVRDTREGAIENRGQEDFVRAFGRTGFRFVPEASAHQPSLSAVRGCLLGGAIGDALGYPIEFEGPGEKLAARYGLGAPSSLRFANGSNAFSDDTQMTLFVAEGLIRARQRHIDRGNSSAEGIVQRALVRWLITQERVPSSISAEMGNGWLFKQGGLHVRRAPGNTCLSALRAEVAGTRAQPANDSKGCGAVMRSAPIGLALPEVARAFRCAADTGRFTHGHPSGYLSGAYFAAVIWGVARGSRLRDAMRVADGLLAAEPGHEEMAAVIKRVYVLAADGPPSHVTIEALGGGWVGEEAIGIALLCALTAEPTEEGFRDAVWRSVLHGGDSDSTGSLTGNLLGAMLGAEALPTTWLAEVEMRDVVDRIARDLFSSMILGRTLSFDDYPPN